MPRDIQTPEISKDYDQESGMEAALDQLMDTGEVLQSIPHVTAMLEIVLEIVASRETVTTGQEQVKVFTRKLVATIMVPLFHTIEFLVKTGSNELQGLNEDLEDYECMLGNILNAIRLQDQSSASANRGNQMAMLDRQLEKHHAQFRNRLQSVWHSSSPDQSLRTTGNTSQAYLVHKIEVTNQSHHNSYRNSGSGNMSIFHGVMMQDGKATKLSEDSLTRELIAWLRAPNVEINYENARKKHHPGTGEWFINSLEYRDWKKNNESILWIHGIPGSGKSVLSATVIAELREACALNPSNQFLAFFYFDFGDRSKQKVEHLLRTLILHFALQCPELPTQLRQLFDRRKGASASFMELLKVVPAMVQSMEKAFIVIDGLDECTEQSELAEFLSAISSWKIPHLHVMVTSRQDRAIEDALEKSLALQRVALQGSAVNKDIRSYIQAQVKAWTKFKPTTISEIETALVQKADGMFRWVACQLDRLAKCRNDYALRHALQTLPKTLDETYDRILSNIPEDDHRDVLLILRWVSFALEPLPLEALQDAIAVDGTKFDITRRYYDIDDLARVCGSLVIVIQSNNSSKRFLRFSHSSVQEYLLTNAAQYNTFWHIQPSTSHATLAQACIGYLLQLESYPDTTKLARDYPLGFYAIENWSRHVLIAGEAKVEPKDLLPQWLHAISVNGSHLLSFLEKETPFDRWDQHVDAAVGDMGDRLLAGIMAAMAGVITVGMLESKIQGRYACTWEEDMPIEGCFSYITDLLCLTSDISAGGTNFKKALATAPRFVNDLLERNSKLDTKFRDFLQFLSACGHPVIDQILNENNKNALNILQSQDPTEAASNRGYMVVVKYLAQHGAKTNSIGGLTGDVLQAASHYGHQSIVEYLNTQGAVAAKQRDMSPFWSMVQATLQGM